MYVCIYTHRYKHVHRSNIVFLSAASLAKAQLLESRSLPRPCQITSGMERLNMALVEIKWQSSGFW